MWPKLQGLIHESSRLSTVFDSKFPIVKAYVLRIPKSQILLPNKRFVLKIRPSRIFALKVKGFSWNFLIVNFLLLKVPDNVFVLWIPEVKSLSWQWFFPENSRTLTVFALNYEIQGLIPKSSRLSTVFD